jgi:glutamate-1-semialdehyde 2,1-aminomutase
MGRMQTRTGVRPDRVATMQAQESERFAAAHTRSAALLERGRASMPRGVPMSWMESLYEYPPVFAGTGSGSRFHDVDGHEYVDMYLGDMSGFCGHAPAPVVEAVSRRMAAGNHFLLPVEDAVVVAEHLAVRYRLPQWQFTLSATQANTEVIRIARQLAGREVVLMFDGKYHGQGDATLVVLEDGRVVPEQQGLPASVTGQARLVQFNDVAGLEAGLAPQDVALVLTEPVMTNTGIVAPVPGFHAALRELTRAAGTLLALDETHSLVGAYGGMAGEFGLSADFLTVGKSIAAGVPLGAYGMTDEVAARSLPAGGRGCLRRDRDGRHAVRERAVDGRRSGRPHGGADAPGVRPCPRYGHPDGGRDASGGRRVSPAVERRADGHTRVLRIHPGRGPRWRRVPRQRRSRPARADAVVAGQPRGMGVRVVARPDRLGGA